MGSLNTRVCLHLKFRVTLNGTNALNLRMDLVQNYVHFHQLRQETANLELINSSTSTYGPIFLPTAQEPGIDLQFSIF